MLDWIQEHRVSLMWGAGLSVAFMAAMMVIGPMVIVRLPADYLKEDRRKSGGKAWRIGRNVLGWILIAGGLAMLALPGPGVLVLLVGIGLADFPGKQRVLRWILSRGKILQSMNRLRARHGKEPLQVDQASESSGKAPAAVEHAT